MHDMYPRDRVPRLLAAAMFAVLGTGAAMANNGRGSEVAQSLYRQEMAVCNSGQSPQDTATCRREAVNAQAAARRGQLTTPPDPASNATQRCGMLPMDQREDCIARITRGDATGSVAGGGILHEYTTIVPAPAQ